MIFYDCTQMVFITALFYLLALSGEQYLPAEWFSKFSPGGQIGAAGGNKFGQAVEEAIGYFIYNMYLK